MVIRRSESRGVEAAVEQYILAGDVGGVDAAEKGAGLAEFVGGAEALGGNLGLGFGGDFRFGFAGILGGPLQPAAQALGIEIARQQVVDGDVLVGDCAGDAGAEGGEAGPGGAGEVEAREGHFDADGGDVDDSAEAARGH